jgi:probable HAF family extracellular repeat protein
MRRADSSLVTVNRRISRTIFVALVVGAIALLSLGTRPAETQEPFAQPLYKVQDLGTLGGPWSQAAGINDAGKVVGGSPASDEGGVHAFLYSGGQMSDLGTLGGSQSYASDINNTDKVVGSSNTNDFNQPERAFLYSGGVMSDLGTLGGDQSRAFGINDADKVVGSSDVGDGTIHAFLYSDGVMRDLNSLIPANSGFELTSAAAINDNGDIVGYGYNQGSPGPEHAFLLRPYFDGFYQPVDNFPTLNKTRAGKTVPIRFSLGRDQGLDIFAAGYPKSETIPCNSTTPVDSIEETVSGKHGLSYNASTDTYEYEWATSSTWSGCRQFVMKFKDGSVQRANFSFSK